MCRTEDGTVRYAPLSVHTFRFTAPRKLLDAQKMYKQYPDYKEIKTVPERLRWCRYRLGLMQSEVAELVGISRGVYGKMEAGELDRFESDVVDKLAMLYGVPVTDLLDDYNLFLYKGQGRQLQEYRESLGVGKRTLARQMGIDHNCIRNWESEKKTVNRASWERYWKQRLNNNRKI